MDLTLDLIYKNKLVKRGISGTYPSTDNCYVVDVYNRETNDYQFTMHYCPKPLFEMWDVLKEMKAKYGIRKTDMLPLIRGFNDWGGWKYDEAIYDASMNSEDI
jgi:hypothetical protein